MRILLTICFIFSAVFLSTSSSAQCLSGDCQEGTGSYKSPNGDIYEGDFKKGKPCGSGTLKYKNGGVYTGKISDGVPEGQGSFTYANGESCE